MSAVEVCYRCGGSVEFDEQGLPYTCYICCNTGYVSKEAFDAWEAEMNRPSEAEALLVLPPHDDEDYWD